MTVAKVVPQFVRGQKAPEKVVLHQRALASEVGNTTPRETNVSKGYHVEVGVRAVVSQIRGGLARIGKELPGQILSRVIVAGLGHAQQRRYVDCIKRQLVE